MKILTCPKCQSQFDVATMQPGSSFVCGKCRNVLAVPAAAPVVQPAPVVRPMAGAAPAPAGPPPTVVLSPDDMKRALAQARVPEAAGKAQAKLPPAMEARRQQQAAQPTARAGGNTAAPAPIPAAAPAAKRPAAAAAPAPAARAAAPAPAAAARPAAPASKRAAAAAEPEEAPAGGRKSRRARGDDEDAPAKKNQTMLYAGVGGGVLVIAVAAWALSSKGGGDATDGTGGTGGMTAAGGSTPSVAPADTAGNATPAGGATQGGGTSNVSTAPAPNLDEWGKYLSVNESEQRGLAASRRSAAGNDPEKLKAAWEWFGDPRLLPNKVAQEARKNVVDDALRADANLDWANEAKGNKNVWDLLNKTRKEAAKAFSYPEADENELDAALQKFEKEKWADQKTFANYEKLMERIRERGKALDSDARLVKVEEKKKFIRGNPAFKDFKFIYRWADPYLICQQYEEYKSEEDKHKNAARLEKANTIANRDAIIFTELNRHFRSLFAERYKLPELKEKERIVFSIITWNHPSYVEFYKAAYNGEVPSPWIRAFYSPPEQKIFHYVGDDSLRAQDEVPVAGGRVQKTSDQVTFHEGTHQLQHEYGAIFRGKPLVDGDKNTPPRKAMWFDEGLAEFMGSVEVEASKKDTLVGATFSHNRLLGERIAQVIGDGRSGNNREVAKKWTIAEMIVPNHNGELLQASGRLLPGNPVYMANLFYARAWGFVHFCWFYDGGKYRKPFLDYMETVLQEKHGTASLVKAFGRKDAKDWKGIDAEFEWYWDRCLGRRFGWKDEGRTKPWNTETDPPEGRYDPNAKEDEE